VNKRERMLLILTLAVVVPLLAYHFFMADAIEGALAGGTGELGEARGQFRQYAKTLEDSRNIREQYQAISFTSPEREGNLSPAQTFQNQISTMLTQQFNIMTPQIESPTFSAIKDVDDYYFVDIAMQVSGPDKQIVSLIQDMNRMGLLIKRFDLKRLSLKFSDSLQLDIEVSRLVKHDAASRKLLKRATWSRR
jgi:hypothetical protein